MSQLPSFIQEKISKTALHAYAKRLMSGTLGSYGSSMVARWCLLWAGEELVCSSQKPLLQHEKNSTTDSRAGATAGAQRATLYGVLFCFVIFSAVYFTMQGTSTPDNESCPPMDECLLRCGHVLERLASYKVDSADLDDFAESIAASFRDELSNESLLSDAEPPSIDDWKLCQRLQPDDSSQSYFLSAGYNDCMEEALRFLMEEEQMGSEHPVVCSLKTHLELARERILSTVSAETNNPDNNNVNRTSSLPRDVSYDCYMAVNFLDTSSICNTG